LSPEKNYFNLGLIKPKEWMEVLSLDGALAIIQLMEILVGERFSKSSESSTYIWYLRADLRKEWEKKSDKHFK
jgi:hypothetical protein